MKQYSYAIIKHNYPELERESALLQNNYKAGCKYAFIEKVCHTDGSENIARILYSNNLEEMQKDAAGYVSWYNYPMKLSKSMQGYISELTC